VVAEALPHYLIGQVVEEVELEVIDLLVMDLLLFKDAH
tara:strand:+ start:193 stop:306 length:114 start_codon:yes stop_codon:yes gene_type:complete